MQGLGFQRGAKKRLADGGIARGFPGVPDEMLTAAARQAEITRAGKSMVDAAMRAGSGKLI